MQGVMTIDRIWFLFYTEDTKENKDTKEDKT